MTVAELIEKLKTFPQDLPVCLSDWNEDYEYPTEKEAEAIKDGVARCFLVGADRLINKRVVIIGSFNDWGNDDASQF